jgi:hypothetical protein
MSAILDTEQKDAINRIAALILMNAMIFQEVLAKTNNRVKTLQSIRSQNDPITALIEHWDFILRRINYYPIFHIAQQLLMCLTADTSTTSTRPQ